MAKKGGSGELSQRRLTHEERKCNLEKEGAKLL